MRNRIFVCATVVAAIATIVCLPSNAAAGQSAAAAQKAWEAPRTPDGQPDIQGSWTNDRGRGKPNPTNIQTGLQNSDTERVGGRTDAELAARTPVTSIIDPQNGKIPYQPWAQKRYEEILSRYNGEDVTGDPQSIRDVSPQLRCIYGTPRAAYFGGFDVVQVPGYVIFSSEQAHDFRVIPLDRARPPLPASVKLYKGDSRGYWDGNTLVVNVTNLNDWTWFDSKGTFHTDAMTLVERFTFVDDTTINYQVTITDSIAFTQPWTMAWPLKREHTSADHYEQLEEACIEGEKAFETLLGHVHPRMGL